MLLTNEILLSHTEDGLFTTEAINLLAKQFNYTRSHIRNLYRKLGIKGSRYIGNTRVNKVTDLFRINIPPNFLRDIGVLPGDRVNVTLSYGSIVITKHVERESL